MQTRLLLALVFTTLVVALSQASQQTGGANQPGTRWTEAQLKDATTIARVGRKLTPKSWPNGARVAVALSFDTDTEAPLLRDGNTSPATMSASEFGAASGIPRILDLLDRHKIPATFFMTGVDALLHPEMVAGVLKSGRHEIGVHGWIHEFTPRLSAEEEEQLLDKAIDYLTTAAGKRPVGYRAPSWKFSGWTMGQVKAAGFLYDSSLMASDDPYEILLDGAPTGVVELPIERILDDAPYFGGNADGSNPSIGDVYEVFQAEFDVAYDEGGLFLLTMHPHMMGHRSRTAMLEKLVQYMKGRPGVWFATHEQIANHVKPLIAAQ